jgi:hypothetical protein
MALQEFVGAVVMEVDTREIDIVSISPRHMTGRRAVRTMNKTGNAAGFSQGVTSIELRITAVVPATGEPLDWKNIQGAKITITPIAGGQRKSYLDCFTTEVGHQYEVDNEARIDISMVALREITE